MTAMETIPVTGYCRGIRCTNLVTDADLCAECTKWACIRAMNVSGPWFPVDKALEAYVKWPIGANGRVDPCVFGAYRAIGEYLDVSTALDANIRADPAALLKCRALIVESVFILNYPRQVQPLVAAIDEELKVAHNMVICRGCTAVIVGGDVKKSVCNQCVHHAGGAMNFLNVDQLVATAIARATGLIRPIGGIIANYVLQQCENRHGAKRARSP